VSKPLNPDLMTPAERLDELAEILAAGVLRARARLRESMDPRRRARNAVVSAVKRWT
jgi:hypothetical protein